jgi:DNA polymerase elongation subunit (family B)
MRRADLLQDGGGPPAPGSDLVFHVTSWHAGDFARDEDEGEDDGGGGEGQGQMQEYVVTAFGVSEGGASVGLTLKGFTPFFYVRVPEGARSRSVRDHLVSMAGKRLHEARVFERKDFWGFTAQRPCEFVRLSFWTLADMRKTASRLQREKQRIYGAGQVQLQVYESNIDPLLRMFHIRDLKPAGWVRVPARQLSHDAGRTSCQVDAACPWTAVVAVERDDIAPLLLAAFDIECASAHGDFPVAIKDYRKLALDLEQHAWPAVKARSEYDAKCALIECMRAALGLAPQEAGCSFEALTSQMARLEFKGGMGPKAAAAAEATVKRVVDDVYSVLRGAKIASAPVDDEGGGSDDDAGDDGALSQLVRLLNCAFRKRYPLKGDAVIQIGTTVSRFGAPGCCARFVYTLGSCEDIDGAHVRTFESEGQMIVAWAQLVRELDPDILLGYNVVGFDMAYMHDRAQELLGRTDRADSIGALGRVRGLETPFVDQKLSSSAMGDNVLRYFDMHGRVLVDLMKVVQRSHKLDSYKLDAVASHFMGLKKHDVGPNDIFRLQRGSAADRRVIAEYCIQDCELCNNLQAKLEIVPNNMGMANVCSVPLSFIFMRGQGVKIFSLVAKQCRADGFLIPVRSKPSPGGDGDAAAEEDSYEGAIVLEPETGMYLDDPVSVLDYNSLYPSSMISENISHDTLVLDRRYADVPGVEYVDVTYDVYEGKGDDKKKVGVEVCRFAQGTEGVLPRILQKLLAARKATRKRIEHVRLERPPGDGGGIDRAAVLVGSFDAAARELRVEADGSVVPLEPAEVERLEPAYDAFERAVLDGMQLAYKVTANSLYGQMGARTSQLYLKQVAACTTAVGRMMIQKAKEFVEGHGGRVVYGDTDSIFVVFRNVDEHGNKLSGREALASSIRQGQAVSKGIRPLLKQPHNLEYEKTMFPLVLLSKKRYVGLLYEDDPDAKPKMKSMGIALKRRDYAPIVKKVYGGIIDIILRERDVPAAVAYLSRELTSLANGQYDLEDLVISKTLRSYYKIPHQIAHWVLARRMRQRDPGSAPQANDRIPYVFIETSKKDALMGDRIEHVEFVKKSAGKVHVDTKTYIVNQIQKPCLQLLAIALESIPGYARKPELSDKAFEILLRAKEGNMRKARERMDTLREREVERLVFAPVLANDAFRQRDNRCARQHAITSFFRARTLAVD